MGDQFLQPSKGFELVLFLAAAALGFDDEHAVAGDP